jgi:hypothetical protein
VRVVLGRLDRLLTGLAGDSLALLSLFRRAGAVNDTWAWAWHVGRVAAAASGGLDRLGGDDGDRAEGRAGHGQLSDGILGDDDQLLFDGNGQLFL